MRLHRQPGVKRLWHCVLVLQTANSVSQYLPLDSRAVAFARPYYEDSGNLSKPCLADGCEYYTHCLHGISLSAAGSKPAGPKNGLAPN